MADLVVEGLDRIRVAETRRPHPRLVSSHHTCAGSCGSVPVSALEFAHPAADNDAEQAGGFHADRHVRWEQDLVRGNGHTWEESSLSLPHTSPSMKDYYRVLRVDPEASEELIRRTYRQLAKTYHPDANPDNRAAEDAFKEISEAYETLIDPEKRRRYDARFGGSVSGSSSAREPAAKASQTSGREQQRTDEERRRAKADEAAEQTRRAQEKRERAEQVKRRRDARESAERARRAKEARERTEQEAREQQAWTATGAAVPIATFKPASVWPGKRIIREGDMLILEGHGAIAAEAVMDHDRRGQLNWAYDGLRAWVGSKAVAEARARRSSTPA